jgi:hypothetical protein
MDGSAVEHVAALPWWPVVGLVGHDHTLPAFTAQLADPLDDAALAPPAANSDLHGGVARAGASLLPGDAVGGAAGVGNVHSNQPDTEVTASGGGSSWSYFTDGSGYAVIYFNGLPAHTPTTVKVGAATCTATWTSNSQVRGRGGR